MLGQADRSRDLLARQEDALGGGPDGQVAERVHHGGGGVGLEVALMDDRGAVRALDDDVGLREAGVEVAAIVGGVIGEVGRAQGGIAAVSSTDLAAGHAVGPDGRGIGLEGVERIEDGREVFVLDVDERERIFGSGLGLGDDGGDGLAAKSGLRRARASRELGRSAAI